MLLNDNQGANLQGDSLWALGGGYSPTLIESSQALFLHFSIELVKLNFSPRQQGSFKKVRRVGGLFLGKI